MKQVDAVVMSVMAILESDESRLEALQSGTPAKELLTDAEKYDIKEQLISGIESGDIAFSEVARAKHDTAAKIKSYVNGMFLNHLNKDKRLNGGVKYTAKNPGSRAGSSDEKLKALKQLLSVTPESQQAVVQAAIEQRLQEIAAEKAKQVVINIDMIPEELRHLIVND